MKHDNFSDKPEDLRRLAELDPAHEHPLPANSARQKIFERITDADRRVTDAGRRADAKSLDLGRRRAPIAYPLRLALAAVAAVAVAALIVLLPFGVETSTSAFATWTPVPGKISADMNQVLDSYCENPSNDPDGPGTYIPPCEIVAKEQRGEVGFAAAQTDRGSLRTAIYVEGEKVLSSFASSPDLTEELGSSEVHTVSRAASVPSSNASDELAEQDRLLVTTVIGLVGSNVEEIEIAVNPKVADPTDSEMFPVQATVEGGVFAAWWPGKEEIAYEPKNGLVLNVTLANGEVIKNVPMFDYLEQD